MYVCVHMRVQCIIACMYIRMMEEEEEEEKIRVTVSTCVYLVWFAFRYRCSIADWRNNDDRARAYSSGTTNQKTDEV